MNTSTNVFISFSFDSSKEKKEKLEKCLNSNSYTVNYSEKEDRSHQSDETIWKYLKNRISGSSVMLVIYSKDFERNSGGKALKVKDNAPYGNDFKKQGWIYKEIRCALRDGKNNALNGVLVIMPDNIFDEKYSRGTCDSRGTPTLSLKRRNYPEILKNNYCNKKDNHRETNCGCCYKIIGDSYIPVVKESVFYQDPKYYIDLTKNKRNDAWKYNIVKETD